MHATEKLQMDSGKHKWPNGILSSLCVLFIFLALGFWAGFLERGVRDKISTVPKTREEKAPTVTVVQSKICHIDQMHPVCWIGTTNSPDVVAIVPYPSDEVPASGVPPTGMVVVVEVSGVTAADIERNGYDRAGAKP